MSQISLNKTSRTQQLTQQLACLIPTPRPLYWWLDIVWIICFGITQEVILPDLVPNWLHFDLLTPWLVFNVITRSGRSVWLIYVLTSAFMEGSSSVPVGFYFTGYILPVIIIPTVRSHLTWSFFTPWFLAYCLTLTWIHGFKFFVHGILANNYSFSMHNLIFFTSAVSFGTVFGSMISRPYQSSEFFAKEGLE